MIVDCVIGGFYQRRTVMYALFINLSSRQRQDYFAAIVILYTGVGTMFNHKIETCAVRCSVISGCSGLANRTNHRQIAKHNIQN